MQVCFGFNNFPTDLFRVSLSETFRVISWRRGQSAQKKIVFPVSFPGLAAVAEHF